MKQQLTTLELPRSAEISKQLADGGPSITFLDIALDILQRLERIVGDEVKDELRFLKDCMHAGPSQTRSPCRLEAALLATPPPKRKDAELRGRLLRGERNDTDSPGVPFLGDTVPQWPTKCLELQSASRMEFIFDEQFNDWCLDIFAVAAASAGRPLLFVGWEALRRSRCFLEFNLNPIKAGTCLDIAEARYAPDTVHAYHNNLHAADVTQSLWSLLTEVGGDRYFDSMDVMVSLLGAIVHDLGHDGKTNGFHCAVQDKLALRYNDKSILENYHASAGFHLFLSDASTNFIADLEKAQQRIFRKECIDLILGTDMSMHFQNLNRFSTLIAKFGQDVAEWFGDEDSMSTLRGMFLHCADISNQTKPLGMAHQWTFRVLTEFFAQGDVERELGLPISPLCDRRTIQVPESQAGFIEFIVRPSFEMLSALIPKVCFICVSRTVSNYLSWKQGTGYLDPLEPAKVARTFVNVSVDAEISDDEMISYL
eukprot:TRINITY_DN21094_c0_g1_i1.p1 TRINITY_DN21094_c0_g1~~TRINITY_DN21094_c0_g1_i1.p1  ORF type:complete len:483 (-),score=90.08 TRINITY_DN21094_c0_g1_i1:128-1576(-)